MCLSLFWLLIATGFTFNIFCSLRGEREKFSQVDGTLQLGASGGIFHIQCPSLAQTQLWLPIDSMALLTVASKLDSQLLTLL